MYGIFTYIYGKYTIPMDPMGYKSIHFNRVSNPPIFGSTPKTPFQVEIFSSQWAHGPGAVSERSEGPVKAALDSSKNVGLVVVFVFPLHKK